MGVQARNFAPEPVRTLAHWPLASVYFFAQAGRFKLMQPIASLPGNLRAGRSTMVKQVALSSDHVGV